MRNMAMMYQALLATLLTAAAISACGDPSWRCEFDIYCIGTLLSQVTMVKHLLEEG